MKRNRRESECRAAVSTEEALAIARGNVDRANYDLALNANGSLWINVAVRCDLTGEADEDVVALHPETSSYVEGRDHDRRAPHAVVVGALFWSRTVLRAILNGLKTLLGAASTPQRECNTASTAGIGVDPGPGWRGWNGQVRSVTDLPACVIARGVAARAGRPESTKGRQQRR
jgi:hypothetical protein